MLNLMGSSHGHSCSQRRFVRCFFRVCSDNSSFDNQARTATPNAEKHEGFPSDLIQERCTDSIEYDANRDPSTLQFELLFSCWMLVVDHKLENGETYVL